ncbi:hydrogen peroxide-inducible genes activator [Cytophagaceae bacterium ABcell3]|nr:hydrogen peroxide-inducible genes activator [Cytophagaceae bacterium ABcell3]
MTLSQLEYLLAVDKYRHFSTAAEHCHVTQPTLSMQLQKLEEELGITVFDRSKQPVIPTTEGIMIIEHAKKIMKEAEALYESVNLAKGVIAGEFRLGVIPTLAPYVIPLFVNKIAEDHPGITLIIEELTTENIIEKLKGDHLDAALLATPTANLALNIVPLFIESFVAYVSENNPLFKKKTLSRADIDSEQEVLILHEGHCMQEQVNLFCKKRLTKNSGIVYEAGSIETLRRMVDIRGGMTFLPELAVYDLSEDQADKVRYFQDPQPAREVSIVTHRSFIKKKLLEIIKSAIIESIPAKMLQTENKQIIHLPATF